MFIHEPTEGLHEIAGRLARGVKYSTSVSLLLGKMGKEGKKVTWFNISTLISTLSECGRRGLDKDGCCPTCSPA